MWLKVLHEAWVNAWWCVASSIFPLSFGSLHVGLHEAWGSSSCLVMRDGLHDHFCCVCNPGLTHGFKLPNQLQTHSCITHISPPHSCFAPMQDGKPLDPSTVSSVQLMLSKVVVRKTAANGLYASGAGGHKIRTTLKRLSACLVSMVQHISSWVQRHCSRQWPPP